MEVGIWNPKPRIFDPLVQSGYEKMRGFPRTLWVALFVEGTRFTKAKLLAAQQFAVKAGMRVPQNVLVPRTKVSDHMPTICYGVLMQGR